MTHRKAAARWSGVAAATSLGRRAAKTKTVEVAINADKSPLPPSSSPYAFPCAETPPHSRVARSIAAQKRRTVVSPQTAHRTFITLIDGMPARTTPPRPVVTSAAVISRRAGNRSASGPPVRYATMATTPYKENAVPSWRFVIPNTSRNVGRKTRAKTKGSRKTASPAAMRATMIERRCTLDRVRSSSGGMVFVAGAQPPVCDSENDPASRRSLLRPTGRQKDHRFGLTSDPSNINISHCDYHTVTLARV